jgi:hypothetical protein
MPPHQCLTLSWRIHHRLATRAPHPAASGGAAGPHRGCCATDLCSCVYGDVMTRKTCCACYCCYGFGCVAQGCGHGRNPRKGKQRDRSLRRLWRGERHGISSCRGRVDGGDACFPCRRHLFPSLSGVCVCFIQSRSRGDCWGGRAWATGVHRPTMQSFVGP